MKKVLILASVASMIGQFNMSNICILLNMGYKVDVACNFIKGSGCSEERIRILKEELTKSGVHCIQIDFTRNAMNLMQDYVAYKQVRELCKKNDYAFLHCHSPIGGAIGRLVGKREKIRVIYTAHGFHFFKGAPLKNWLMFYPIEKVLSHWTDILITINHEDYNRAREKFYAKKVEYIPGIGVEVSKYGISDELRREKRQELGFTDASRLILSVGELNKNKNHEVVIRALAHLKERKDFTQIQYLICGKGKCEKKLKSLAIELGIEKNIHLLGYREDIAAIYGCADIFVFMSYREGLPVALMEAMATGLPCVCSKGRGMIDLISNNRNGLLAENDSKEVAKIISALIDDNGKRLCLGSNAKKTMKQFDSSIVYNSLTKIYKMAGKE